MPLICLNSKRLLAASMLVLAWFVGSDFALAQTSRTWNGSASSDWFNATNWTPPGVPGTNDIVNVTNGTVNFSAPVTINNQFNWSGGTLEGTSLTIATNGLMNISPPGTLFLQCPLTNAGTVTWTNLGNLDVLNGNGLYFGQIYNLAGAVWNIQSDQDIFNNAAGVAFFHNAGTLEKSSNTGITSFGLVLDNPGNVTASQGTLSFTVGGVLAGTFTAGAGTAIDFSGGTFTNSAPVALNGPGVIQLTGNGNLLLLTDTIANLALVQGTVSLGPGFQGGTITNLTIAGATLAGTNTVTGVFDWNNGTVLGALTVATNGVLNISGSTTMYLQGPLTNAGTVIWTNVGDLDVLNGSGIYFGQIYNLAGGLWNIQNDQDLFNNAAGLAFFHNAGTLEKTSHTGITSIGLLLDNTGSMTALQGELNFIGGGMLTGTFTAAAGEAIDFSGGTFTNSGPVTLNGPGVIQLTGSASLLLLTDTITNLPLVQGTVSLGPGFQGGTITNLTIAGATLAGTNTVTGVFDWNNGTVLGALTVATNGVLNISGSTTMYLQGPLTNAGTVIWTNVGDLDVLNGSGIYFGLIQNLAGGLWNMQSDQNLFNNAAGVAYFYNAGTLEKSSHTGSSTIGLPVTNAGTITALQGNIAFQNGITLGGGSLFFGMRSAANYGSMTISGNATLDGTAGVLWLNGFVPAFGNSFTVLTYGSYTGAFTNLSLPPAAIWDVTYNPTSFVLAIGSIDKLAFTTQPMGGKLTNQVLLPVVVQVEDPSGNPQATNGLPVTLSLNSGSGVLSGTLTQNTDSTGKATFSDLSINVVGTKTLRAASSGLTASASTAFAIVPLVGTQWTSNGFVLQLNGTNIPDSTIIYASTNLTSWSPIYTNGPTNGAILFLDPNSTNFPRRFYRFSQQ